MYHITCFPQNFVRLSQACVLGTSWVPCTGFCVAEPVVRVGHIMGACMPCTGMASR